jgi:hypothetical protein
VRCRFGQDHVDRFADAAAEIPLERRSGGREER